MKKNLAALALSASGLIMAAIPVEASTTVAVDGIFTTGEYSGTDSGSKSLLWFNGHESIYTPAAGYHNPLYYEINGAGTDWSLNLFFEVPTYARRMYWEDGCKYSGTMSGSGCTADVGGTNTQPYLDAYFDGTHHKSVKMDYKTQTKSEFFELLDGTTSVSKTLWQDEDSDGLADLFTWATSREYLINSGICTETSCYELDRTSSIELMWSGLSSRAEAFTKFDQIDAMELHLSDEARGLPPVPLPGGFPLLAAGIAAMGLLRQGRKRQA